MLNFDWVWIGAMGDACIAIDAYPIDSLCQLLVENMSLYLETELNTQVKLVYFKIEIVSFVIDFTKRPL